MIVSVRAVRLLVVCILAALGASIPGQAAFATPTANDWAAWGLTVGFTGGSPSIVYTAYAGRHTPNPVVTVSYSEDITPTCTFTNVTYSGDYAVFDNSTSISCPLPSWRTTLAALDPALAAATSNQVMQVPGTGPLWVAAEVALAPVNADNPLLDARDLGMVASLPRSGGTARTRIALSSGSYTSPSWAVDPNGANRVLMGMDGPAMVAVDNAFNWMGFLQPSWKSYFNTNVAGQKIGYWAESSLGTDSGVTSAVAPYTLKTSASTVYIGYNATTGAHFQGKIRSLRFDPGSKGN